MSATWCSDRSEFGRSWSQDAVGIAVHIAARLEQSAEPGTICLSGAVWRLARGFVTAVPLDPIVVKGVDTPIERLRLVDADRTANRWGVRAANGLATFVDRAPERAALARALEHGKGSLRLVQLFGGAGLGKSRLLHEFLAGDVARASAVISLIGDHHRRMVPFHPVASWLRLWLDIRSADPLPEARRKAARGLAALPALRANDRELLERMLGLGAAGPDIDSLGALTRVDFGGAIATLLTTIAAGRRIILVCEDLDTFDAATRELLESALRRLNGRDVLVVTASRTRVRLAGVLASATRKLTLTALSEDDATTLLASIDPGLAGNAALSAAILRKAGGNPLFLEEVAPLVMPRPSGGPPGLDDTTDQEIPDRVEALIADRLGRLTRPLRRLVQLCAVIGTDVPVPLLSRLAGIPQQEVHTRLLRLQSENLLYESRKYPDPQFTFKHALTRDVAYRTILASRRRDYHARIVDLLQAELTEAPGAHHDELCLHAIQAQLWPRAVAYLQRAARYAVERAANQMALAYLQRAREIATSLPPDEEADRRRLDVLMNLRALVMWTGDYEDFGQLLDEAEIVAERLDDRPCLLRILAARVHQLNMIGRNEDAIALGERARASARQSGDVSLMATSGFFTGQSYFNAGKLDLAERTLSENVEAMAAWLRSNTGPQASNGSAGNDSPGNDPAGNDPAGGNQASAAEMTLNHGHLQTIAPMIHGTRALARAFQGAFTSALQDVHETRRLAELTGRPYDRAFAHTVTGTVALRQRRQAESEAAFRAALALIEQAQVAQLKPPVLVGLGHVLLLGADLAEASEVLTAAHRLTRDVKRPHFQVSAASGLAFTSLRLGEPDLARGFADEAVEMAQRLGLRGYGVQALRVRGLVLAATAGLEDEGLEMLEASRREAIELGMVADIAHAHAALAASGAADAEAHLAKAGRAYRELEMDAWFDHVRAAVAAGELPYL